MIQHSEALVNSVFPDLDGPITPNLRWFSGPVRGTFMRCIRETSISGRSIRYLPYGNDICLDPDSCRESTGPPSRFFTLLFRMWLINGEKSTKMAPKDSLECFSINTRVGGRYIPRTKR